ncbi:hypothetical protein ACOBQX_22950 [Actinokineospora sp. G85]|uniref:hypothetical protein n=1 Tax=Actinokineospora sp. G85 TaxID=3406626 RepID=UPI003C78408E
MSAAGSGWEIADDPAAVHDLLLASDAHQAELTGSPAPARRLASTEFLVGSGFVHLARVDGAAAAMFTLSDRPPFDLAQAELPPAVNPLYLQRLAVRPDLLRAGSTWGVRCVRRAVAEAAGRGADSLRCEANPDLAGSVGLLTACGFLHSGPVHADDSGRRWVHLHRPLV